MTADRLSKSSSAKDRKKQRVFQFLVILRDWLTSMGRNKATKLDSPNPRIQHWHPDFVWYLRHEGAIDKLTFAFASVAGVLCSVLMSLNLACYLIFLVQKDLVSHFLFFLFGQLDSFFATRHEHCLDK